MTELSALFLPLFLPPVGITDLCILILGPQKPAQTRSEQNSALSERTGPTRAKSGSDILGDWEQKQEGPEELCSSLSLSSLALSFLYLFLLTQFPLLCFPLAQGEAGGKCSSRSCRQVPTSVPTFIKQLFALSLINIF